MNKLLLSLSKILDLNINSRYSYQKLDNDLNLTNIHLTKKRILNYCKKYELINIHIFENESEYLTLVLETQKKSIIISLEKIQVKKTNKL